MTPIFYEDSLGAKLAEKARAAMDKGRHPGTPPAVSTSDQDLIDDPATLAAAEAATHRVNPEDEYERYAEDWVVVFGPSKVSGILDVAGFSAALIAMPLAAEGIEYLWTPYPPEEMPGTAAPFEHGADMPFSLLVAPDDSERAREIITAIPGTRSLGGVPATHDRSADVRSDRRFGASALLVLGYGLGIASTILVLLWAAVEAVKNR
jgi:hypothetical protein